MALATNTVTKRLHNAAVSAGPKTIVDSSLLAACRSTDSRTAPEGIINHGVDSTSGRHQQVSRWADLRQTRRPDDSDMSLRIIVRPRFRPPRNFFGVE